MSRGLVFIDTLHPIFEGRGARWNDAETNESDMFEYGSTNEGEAAQAWRSSIFYHMLEHGHEELPLDLANGNPHNFGIVGDLAEKGHKHLVAYVHQFGEAGTMGQMDCVYSYWTTRRDEGFGAQGPAALRDPGAGAGACDQDRGAGRYRKTLGWVISAATPPNRCCAAHRARRHRQINTVLWFSGCAARPRSANPSSRTRSFRSSMTMRRPRSTPSMMPVRGAQAIGDGVLAMFTNENMALAKTRRAFRRASLPAQRARSSTAAAPAKTAGDDGPCRLHVGEVFYGNIGSDDRLDFTVVGPAVNEVSRIASMCRSVDRELLMSSAFRSGLDAAGRNYLVSTGLFALRGISRAQDLYTLDPDITADEVVGGKYERYLAG